MPQIWSVRYFTVTFTVKNKEILLQKLIKKLNLLNSFTVLLVFRDGLKSK